MESKFYVPSPEDPFIPCQVSMRVIIFCNTANEYQRKRAIIYYITNYAMRFGDGYDFVRSIWQEYLNFP